MNFFSKYYRRTLAWVHIWFQLRLASPIVINAVLALMICSYKERLPATGTFPRVAAYLFRQLFLHSFSIDTSGFQSQRLKAILILKTSIQLSPFVLCLACCWAWCVIWSPKWLKDKMNLGKWRSAKTFALGECDVGLPVNSVKTNWFKPWWNAWRISRSLEHII